MVESKKKNENFRRWKIAWRLQFNAIAWSYKSVYVYMWNKMHEETKLKLIHYYPRDGLLCNMWMGPCEYYNVSFYVLFCGHMKRFRYSVWFSLCYEKSLSWARTNAGDNRCSCQHIGDLWNFFNFSSQKCHHAFRFTYCLTNAVYSSSVRETEFI